MSAYLAFARRREPGPNNAIPGVLVVTPTPERCAQLKDAIRRLDQQPRDLITVTTSDAATSVLTAHLFTEQ
jgi:hypothetical protein